MAIDKKGMSPYEAERERTVQENKRKMEALNLRHLSSAVVASYAPKTPSPMVSPAFLLLLALFCFLCSGRSVPSIDSLAACYLLALCY